LQVCPQHTVASPARFYYEVIEMLRGSMFKNAWKAIGIGCSILVCLTAACGPTLNAQDERFQALEEKVNSVAAMETELAVLRGAVADLQTQQDGLISRVDTLTGEMDTGTPAGKPENAFEIVLAQYILDTAGFHEMAEILAETGQVDPAYLSTVNRVQKVFSSIPWPAALAEPGQAFITQLEAFRAALEADNAEEAARLTDLTHEAQHDLSHSIDDFLGVGGDED
jgi:hypothetical protein